MKLPISAAAFLAVACFGAYTYTPNENTGMVKVSVSGTDLANVVKAYENTGFHDFGLAESVLDVPQITSINDFYLYDFNLALNEPYLDFSVKGRLDANAKQEILGFITMRPDVRTNGIRAKASAFFGEMGVADDNNVHLNVCLSQADANVGGIHYGYGAFFDYIINYNPWYGVDEMANTTIDVEVAKKRAEYEKTQKCMDITDFLTISYPKFLGDIGIGKAGTKVENNQLVAYGCPVAKTKLGNTTVVRNQPCETATLNVGVFTSPDVGDAGTNSKITLEMCGNTVTGAHACITKVLDDKTKKGGISYFSLETTKVFTDNLEVTLTSSTPNDGWYADSVVVDMELPNNKTFHYWFPVSTWLDKKKPAFNVKQNDNWQVYSFDVETGEEGEHTHAGTDADVVAVACDVNGKCLGFWLDKSGYDDFEGGFTNHFDIVTKENLGPISHLTIHNLYNNGDHKGWYIKDVNYRHYSYPNGIDHKPVDSHKFMFRQWLAKGETNGNHYTGYACNIPQICKPATSDKPTYLNTVNSGNVTVFMDMYATRYVADNFGYDVIIDTKNSTSAGTDATIILSIEDCSGEIEKFDLDNSYNNFEKGNRDHFQLSGIKNLKGIKSLKLENDKSGDGAGWCPSYLELLAERFNPETGVLDTTNRISISFNKCLNSSDGWSRTYPIANACADMAAEIGSFIYETRAGEYLILRGKNLSGHKVTLNLGKEINAAYVTEDRAKFFIPEDVAIGLYELGSVKVDDAVQQVFINVVGPKPILDGVSVTVVEPENAFEVSVRNISEKAQFFLDTYPLARLSNLFPNATSQPSNSVILKAPANIPNGRYKLRVVDNGWDITTDQEIEVYKMSVPHVKSLSSTVVYTGDVLTIWGENFGTTLGDISVKIGTLDVSVVVLTNEKIVVSIPQNFSGKNLPVTVKRKNESAPEKLFIEVIDLVPHISSISSNTTYTGDVVTISGNNFGTAVEDIEVFIDGVAVVVKSVANNKISIVIPPNLSGNDLLVEVRRKGYVAPEKLTITVKSIPLFLTFDDKEKVWTSDDAVVSYDDVIKQGENGYSLKVNGDGYKTIKSPVFNTVELGALSDKIQLDVWIPSEQVNEFWKGEVQLVVDIPAAGLYNAWVGQVLLTDLPSGWNTVEFELNDDIYKALSSDYPNARFVIVLNANQNAEDFRIDNLRFVGDVKVRETEHVVAHVPMNIYATDFMSFDNIGDWNVSTGDLLFVAEPHVEGLGAIGVNASGYVVVTSRNFKPAEIDFATSTISVDVYVPNPQPNDYWVGELSMSLNCPEEGIHNLYLGGQDLTHMFREEYNNVQFRVPTEAVAALQYGVGECNISLNLNVNDGSGLFLLDNMGFIKTIEIARVW